MKFDAVRVDDLLQRLHPRQRALDAQFEKLVGQQPAAAAAAERLLGVRLARHFHVLVDDRRMTLDRESSTAPGSSPCARSGATLQESWNVTTRWSLASLSNVSAPRPIRSQVSSRYASAADSANRAGAAASCANGSWAAGADAGQRVPVAVRHAPRMPAFADDDALTPRSSAASRMCSAIFLQEQYVAAAAFFFRMPIAVLEALQAENIGTGVHYRAVHLHPYYRDTFGYRPETFPHAEFLSQRTLSIPFSTRLTEEDARDVIDGVRKVLRAAPC